MFWGGAQHSAESELLLILRDFIGFAINWFHLSCAKKFNKYGFMDFQMYLMSCVKYHVGRDLWNQSMIIKVLQFYYICKLLFYAQMGIKY